jgi:hypothetical protein
MNPFFRIPRSLLVLLGTNLFINLLQLAPKSKHSTQKKSIKIKSPPGAAYICTVNSPNIHRPSSTVFGRESQAGEQLQAAVLVPHQLV